MRRKSAGTVQIPSAALDRVLNARRNKDPFQRDSAQNSSQPDWFRMEASGSGTTEIYIYDEIGFWGTTASEFQQLVSAIDTPRIDLYLNSPGGEVFDGAAIYNALKMHKAYVTVRVTGLAASAASFIAQAGDKVIVMRGSMMMVHDASGLCWGNAQDMAETANLLDKVSNNIADIYAQRTGDTIESWRSLMQEEVWFNAQEAVDANLADEVSDAQVDKSPTDTWNLSVFNYAGRDKAPSPADVRQSIKNKAPKETPVAEKPRNEGGAVTPPPVPTAPPAEGGTEGAPPTEPGTPEAPEGTTPEGAPASEAAPVEAPAPEPSPTNLAGSASYVINGVKVTDPAKVQAHINSLEGAQREARDANRVAFIKQLCDDNKITASQVTSLEEFVLDPDMTDRQYEKWAASWNAASPLAGLGRQLAGGPGNGGDTVADEAEVDQALQTAKDIVLSNMRASMPKNKLEATASWKKLVAAGFDPNTLRESQ